MAEAIRQGDIPGVQLRYRQDLSVSQGEAWRRLTSTSALESWLCDEATMAAEEGSELEWRGSPDLGPECVELGSIVAVEAPRLLVASIRQPDWSAATRLRIELSATEIGCEVSVLQNGFEHLPFSDSLTIWEAYRRRWRAALERLAASA